MITTESIGHSLHRHAYLLPSLTPGMQYKRSANITYIDCGLSCDTFNIIYIHKEQAVTRQELQQVLEYYRSKAFDFCIWVYEQQLTTSLKNIFGQLQLKEVGIDEGMSLDLDYYSIKPIPMTQQAHIKVASTVAEIVDFGCINAYNWTPPDPQVVEYYQRVSTTLLSQEQGIILANYYIEDKAVAAIELFPSDAQTIGIYNFSTLFEYRGRGIGTDLFTFALNKAKELGYRWVVLQASTDGIGIYQRLGFTVQTRFFEFK